FEIDRDVLKYRVPSALGSQSTPDTLMRAAFETRPDLRALGYQKDRAQASIDLAKRNRIPDISLNVQYTPSSTAQPQTLSFGITAPLPVFYQQQGEVKKAEADYATQSAQRAKLSAQVVSDVESGYAAFSQSRVLVERMESTLLERAKTARDITKRQFD